MIEASDIHTGNLLLLDGTIYKVLSVSFSGTAKAEKQIKVTMKSIPEGKFQERVFSPHEKLDNISPDIRKAQYIYADDENVYFMDQETYEQFLMPKKIFGEKLKFMKDGDVFNIQFYNNNPLDVSFPQRIKVKVIQAPAPIKDKSTSVYKQVTLENGVQIDAPQFIKAGDIIEIDSEKFEYIDRVKE